MYTFDRNFISVTLKCCYPYRRRKRTLLLVFELLSSIRQSSIWVILAVRNKSCISCGHKNCDSESTSWRSTSRLAINKDSYHVVTFTFVIRSAEVIKKIGHGATHLCSKFISRTESKKMFSALALVPSTLERANISDMSCRPHIRALIVYSTRNHDNCHHLCLSITWYKMREERDGYCNRGCQRVRQCSHKCFVSGPSDCNWQPIDIPLS